MSEWRLAVIAICATLTACGPVEVTAGPAAAPLPSASGHASDLVKVWRDPETGCEYLVMSDPNGNGGITPRMMGVSGVLYSVQAGCRYGAKPTHLDPRNPPEPK